MMFKLMNNGVFFAIVIIFSLCCPSSLTAQDSAFPNMEGEPAYTLREAEAFVKEIVPLVEKTAGRKFTAIPEIRLVNRLEITEVLTEEFKPQLKSLHPSFSTAEIYRLSSSQAASYAVALLGKYGTIDKRLYLLPANFYPLFIKAKIDARYVRPILMLVIAHELTHALQDQETDLKRLENITSEDELAAFSATIEGHAVFIQEQVGAWLDLADAVREFSRLLSAGGIVFDDPAEELTKNAQAAYYEQVYLGGKRFIVYHCNLGGSERIWEILARPPVTTAMISHPETYSPVKEEETDYSFLFAGLEKELDASDWQITNTGLGLIQILSDYAKIAEQDREELISQIVRSQVFVAQKKDGKSVFNVSVILLREAGFSKKYIALLEDLAKKNVLDLGSSSSIHLSDFSATDFPGIKADIARKITFYLSMGNDKKRYKQIVIRVVRGNVVLECFVSNYEFEDSAMIRVIEEIFSKYEHSIK